MHVFTTILPPYGQLQIDGGETFAYVNGDAPKVYLQIGSDPVTVPEGQCVPVPSHWAKLCNPYPRPITLTVARGAPVRFGARATTVGQHHLKTVLSQSYRVDLAGAVGTRIGYGFLMKRGTALMSWEDPLEDDDSKCIIFRGANAAFMAAKPAGAFMSTPAMRGLGLDVDTSMTVVSGYYTEADITTWTTNAGYTGTIIPARNMKGQLFQVSTEDALFFCKYNAKEFRGMITIQHNGADLGEFD